LQEIPIPPHALAVASSVLPRISTKNKLQIKSHKSTDTDEAGAHLSFAEFLCLMQCIWKLMMQCFRQKHCRTKAHKT
jgi:hypothetical protein